MNYREAKKYVRAFATVRYIEERPFTIAIITLTFDQKTLVSKELSTCSKTDRWDSERDKDIARGRAEAKLARRIMRMSFPAADVIPTVPCVNIAIDGIVYYQL